VLDHQRVRHDPLKTILTGNRSKGKEDQIADNMALQHQELMRHPKHCCFTQRAKEGTIRIVRETHVAYTLV